MPFPSPGDLPNPGMEPRSPTLQMLSHLSHQGSHIQLYANSNHTHLYVSCILVTGFYIQRHPLTSATLTLMAYTYSSESHSRDPHTRSPESTAIDPHGDNVTRALSHSHMPPQARKCLCHLLESLKHKPIAIASTTPPPPACPSFILLVQ